MGKARYSHGVLHINEIGDVLVRSTKFLVSSIPSSRLLSKLDLIVDLLTRGAN